jgi:branched-chain amino acid aminotransferase
MRDQHVNRLYRSAEGIGLDIPIPRKDWPALLHEAMIRNEVGHERADAYLRVTISRGEGDIGLDPALCKRATVVVMAKPLVPPSEHLYRQGVSLTVARTKRNLPEALSPHIKATNFLNNILAKREALAAGTFDSLLLNWRDELTECTVSNLFFVMGGRLCTPALECGILDGITRNIVLQLAAEAAIDAEEGRYTLSDLSGANECFLTNTSMEIMPVTRIAGAPVATGMPGPLTSRLRALFAEARDRFLEPAE